MSLVPKSKVALRVCSILQVVLDAEGPVSFATMMERTGMNRRTLFRYLAALEECGLIERGIRGTELGDRIRSRAVEVEVSA